VRHVQLGAARLVAWVLQVPVPVDRKLQFGEFDVLVAWRTRARAELVPFTAVHPLLVKILREWTNGNYFKIMDVDVLGVRGIIRW
jgi:hypothetical protein